MSDDEVEAIAAKDNSDHEFDRFNVPVDEDISQPESNTSKRATKNMLQSDTGILLKSKLSVKPVSNEFVTCWRL